MPPHPWELCPQCPSWVFLNPVSRYRTVLGVQEYPRGTQEHPRGALNPLYHGFDGFVPCQREALFPGYIDKPCDYGSTVFHNPPCSRRTGMIMGVLFSIILPVRKPCDYGSTLFHNTPCLQTVCYPSPRAIFGGPLGILEALWHSVS